MELDPRRPEEPKVSLTPLIDVVLLLLIFFMVSTTFIEEAELTIELPEASLQPDSTPPEGLEVTVTARGAYLVQGRELVNFHPDTLRAALRESAGAARDLPVVIRADAAASHQSVVTVMDVAGRLGFSRISIVTVNQGEAGGDG